MSPADVSAVDVSAVDGVDTAGTRVSLPFDHLNTGTKDPMAGAAASTRIVLAMADRFQMGRIAWRLPKGGMRITGKRPLFADPTNDDASMVDVTVTLNTDRATRRLLTGGNIGAGEAYMDGDYDVDHLGRFLHICAANVAILERTLEGSWATRSLAKIFHWFNKNTTSGSRKNIQYHYDLGNGFYKHWLDETMTYSSAEYARQDEPLAQAQFTKYENLAQRLQLSPGQHVLEVGCGWGGFAEHVAKHHGVQVTGLTISDEQHAFASERMQKEGLSDRVQIVKRDYRDETSVYDRVASIEMFEAVGEQYWPVFFSKLNDWLSDTGRAAMQIITIGDEHFDRYRAHPDFIQRYIFPGGMLPSPTKLREVSEQAGFTIDAYDTFGKSYGWTLDEWNTRFQAAWDDIRRASEQNGAGRYGVGRPFDERFRRMWEYYLCYCAAGFHTGTIDVCRVAFSKR